MDIETVDGGHYEGRYAAIYRHDVGLVEVLGRNTQIVMGVVVVLSEMYALEGNLHWCLAIVLYQDRNPPSGTREAVKALCKTLQLSLKYYV